MTLYPSGFITDFTQPKNKFIIAKRIIQILNVFIWTLFNAASKIGENINNKIKCNTNQLLNIDIDPTKLPKENLAPNRVEMTKQNIPYMATSNINLIILYATFLQPKYPLIKINISTPLIIKELIIPPYNHQIYYKKTDIHKYLLL